MTLLPEQAQERILETVRPGPPESVAPENARRRALVLGVLAPRDLPAFPQSAMDGYAVAAGGPVCGGERFRLVGTSRAGAGMPPPLRFGEAIRIFTGAPVPPGTSLIAPQEIARAEGESVQVLEAVSEHKFVRLAGSDVGAGAEALPAGSVLGPAALGLLKALGVDRVDVHRAPRIALVASGDELAADAAALQPGQVLESSSHALRWALEDEGLELASFTTARDDQASHREALGAALASADFTLVTGGVSVGDFDLVRPVLVSLGVETVFWRVKQRPGGPLFFGTRASAAPRGSESPASGGGFSAARYVFGLPGNPASTLVCFYEHVLPGLRRFLGWREPRLPRVRAVLAAEVRKPAEKTLFVRARLVSERGELHVEPDPQQESHTLRSFAAANALAIFPAGATKFAPGDSVQCDLLPGRPLPWEPR